MKEAVYMKILKKWYFTSGFLSILILACMASIPQTALAKVGPVIGGADISLQSCAPDKQPATACTIHFSFSLSGFPKKDTTTYYAFIAKCSGDCGAADPVYGPVDATVDSSGVLRPTGSGDVSNSSLTNLITQTTGAWHFCVFSVNDPTATDKLVARGDSFKLSTGPKTRKVKGHTMVHSVES